MVQTGGLCVLRFLDQPTIGPAPSTSLLFFWFRQIKYPKATITIMPTTTPTPMPAFAPPPKPVLEEPEDGNDEDAAGVEAVVEDMVAEAVVEAMVAEAVVEIMVAEAVVDAMVAEVLVDEKAVEVENPVPTSPPIVVTLTKSPR